MWCLQPFFFQHSPEILIAREDSGIKTPQDLVGRRVEMRSDGGIESRAMFLNEGISLNDIRIVEHSWGIDDLINGKVDASEGYITDRPFMLRERGVPYVIIRPLTYGIDFYGDCLFTSEKQVKEHPRRVKAFREASLRGWNYAMEHSDEIIDVILDKYNPRLSRELLRFEAEATRKLMLPNVIEIGHMNPGRWRHIADTYVRLGMVRPGYSLKGFLYDPDAGADYTWLRWTLGITLSALVLIGTGFVSLFIFNKKLHKAVQERSAELSKLNKELVSEIAERKQTEEELERHRLHLEELVRERTRELEAKTENL
ncbi:MAG: ABC transporter substrate-binding protein, partial [Deferribacteres bacterium]|nr:ABC transporter substrate-binding protein [Deferribacteres bacterium]